MSRFVIKATNEGQPMPGYLAVVKMDGRPVESVRQIDLHVGVDDAVTARMDVIATESLDVEVDAMAVISFCVVDTSFSIEETPLPNGGRRIRAVRHD